MDIIRLHLSFIERFTSAPRGGKIASTGYFGQLRDAEQNRSAKSVHHCDSETRNSTQSKIL
jgi:hypothetical protein